MYGIHSIQIVQFSCSVMSNSLRPHESQHTRPPCPSPTPRVHSNSCPLSRWCHPAISSSVVPFSSCPQSLPPSESFPMSQLFAWGGQSTGVSEELIINSWFLGKFKKFARERGLWRLKWTQQWPDQNIQMIIRILWELLGSTAPLSWTGGIFLIFSTESEGLASESAFTLLTPEAYFGNGRR